MTQVKRGILIACCLGGLAVLVSACEARPASLTDADRAAIRAATDAFAKAQLAGDWRSIAAAYSEDAILLPANGPAVQGRDNIHNWFTGLPKSTTLVLTIMEIDGYDDLAYVWGTYEQTMLVPNAKEPVKDTGKFLDIRRRQPDGSWVVTRDMFNSDGGTPITSSGLTPR